MSLSEPLRQQISDLVTTNRVVLFMKGTRRMPQAPLGLASSEPGSREFESLGARQQFQVTLSAPDCVPSLSHAQV